MISTLIKYILLDKCIDVLFSKLISVTDPAPKSSALRKNLEYTMLEMRELSYTTSKSGRRIPFKRMDTYSYGTIIEVSDSGVSFTYSKQSMTFICAQEHFDDMYDILQTTHREKHKRIFGYRTTGSICVEITESDIATVDIADISEIVTYVNRKCTRISFI